MRCFSSALASRLGGMPGSNGCPATPTSSSGGICRSACGGLSLGSGLDSCMTQPPAASSATQPAAPSTRRLAPRNSCISSRIVFPHAFPYAPPLLSLGIPLVVDVFLPELFLQLRIGLLLRRLSQPARDHIVVAAVGNLTRARAVAGVVVGFLAGLLGLQVPRRIAGPGPTRVPAGSARLVRVVLRPLGGCSARGTPALVRALCVGGGAARCGGPARIALLRNPLLFGAQLGIEGAERIIELLVDRRPALVRCLSRSVCARCCRGARPAARRRGARCRVTCGAGARRGRLRRGCGDRAARAASLPA